MPYTTLIDVGGLAAIAASGLQDGSMPNQGGPRALVLVDCRYQLADESWGGREYLAGHIPRAVYAHLGHDLSGPQTGRNGRHPLPDAGAAGDTFGRLGISDGVQVVAYDQDAGMYASRLWWLLRWLGHD